MGHTKLFNLFSPLTVTDSQQLGSSPLVPNSHEPLSPNDPPAPAGANFYRADDHIYHHINGQWKRSPVSFF